MAYLMAPLPMPLNDLEGHFCWNEITNITRRAVPMQQRSFLYRYGRSI